MIAPVRVLDRGLPTASNPVLGTDRNRSLDIIRGVAVFGLIWVNAQSWSTTDSSLDKVSAWFVAVLASGKFWTLFSILFGVTLAMQLDRATARGEELTARWLRRMAGLFAIGVANAILFWPGDILRPYAIAGVLLLLFRKVSQRVLLFAAAAIWLLAANGQGTSFVLARIVGRSEAAAQSTKRVMAEMAPVRQRMQAAQRQGTFVEAVNARAELQVKGYVARSSGLAGPLNLVIPDYLALFLLGLYAGRRRLLQDVAANRQVLQATAAAGLLIGLPLSVLTASPTLVPAWWHTSIPGTAATIGGLSGQVSHLVLASGYLCAFALLFERRVLQQRLNWLGPVGRMGLTNYVTQLALLTTLQNGYGFGLVGRIGSLAWALIAVAIFVLQVGYSNWWLTRFSYGPLEWIWRRVTYWQAIVTRTPVVAAR